MKIGTITFHWASNYGAVLQAFALQRYLLINGYDTEIINYIPFRIKFYQILSNVKNMRVNNQIKEYRINKFRKQCLKVSSQKYYTNNNLIKKCHEYDVYICGSDQVWNESFTLTAEGKSTLSYYLNFVNTNKTRISYATSFGTDKLTSKVINLIKPELEKFKSIGVRENTGKEIINNMGLQATLVADPTLLLRRESYEKLIENKNIKEQYQLFSYILHNNQIIASSINDYVFDNYFDKKVDKKYNQEPIGIFEWLYNVQNANLVLTNSFHGTIFSIIFHTPFIVVPVKGSEMNDRIKTLLNSICLENRIVDRFDKNDIDKLMQESINWDRVDNKVQQLRRSSIEFLDKVLQNIKE